MPRRACRNVATAAALAAAGVMAVTAAPAAAVSVTIPVNNWAVWGSVTDKKLNEPVTLPKGAAFNGSASLTVTSTEASGTLGGSLSVPPFKASLKLAGAIPTTVGVTLTEVGESQGTISTAPAADCARGRTRLIGICATLNITSKANLGITSAGVLIEGLELPLECETSEPLVLHLTDTLPIEELDETHFKGTVTIPSMKCGGLDGLLVGPVLTELMSGPENPYALNLAPKEPSAPTVTTVPALGVSQVSARLVSEVKPDGEPVTECRFEYGTSTSYGSSLPCIASDGYVNSDVNGFMLSTPTGLSEGTVYHYRAVATNSLGTAYGSDGTFTTLGQAGSPEYGRCVEQKKAQYEDPNCTTKSAKPNRGSYEWKPGPAPSCVAQKKGEYTEAACNTKAAKAHKGSFEKAPGPGYSSTTGAVTLEMPEPVVCASSTAAGEVTGVRTGVDRITFTGCEKSGKKCTSEGANSTPSGQAGVIVTNLLDTRLLGPVFLNQVWTEFTSSQHEPYAMEFGCEGQLFRSKGSLAGAQSGDVNLMSTASATTISAAEVTNDTGEQALVTELSENGGTSWGAAEPSSELDESSNTSASKIEIKR